MKRWACIVLAISMLVGFYVPVFGIDLMYIDTRGFRNYSCGANRRGAKIAIKDIGRDRFQIYSSLYTGIMTLPKETATDKWCTGIMGAVRVLCGLCEHPESRGRREDRKKQLGLVD